MKDLKVIFMGTPDFAVPILEKLIENTNVVLVVSQPDSKVGRKQEIIPTPIKKLALENNILADIIITCAYGQIIPPAILEYPRLGCINVHASLLPKYRGGAPIHHALINGEEKTGITIMYMDEGMDSGDIIAKKEYLIKDNDNVGTLHEILAKMGAELLIATLPSIINKTNNRLKQNPNEVSFARIIKREDERIDFNLTGKEIINKIRGLNPWPVANFLWNNLEYKVLEARFELKKTEKPGKIVCVSKNMLGISCQDGIIYLEKIKPFGKKTMDIKDYLNGVKKEELLGQKVN